MKKLWRIRIVEKSFALNSCGFISAGANRRGQDPSARKGCYVGHAPWVFRFTHRWSVQAGSRMISRGFCLSPHMSGNAYRVVFSDRFMRLITPQFLGLQAQTSAESQSLASAVLLRPSAHFHVPSARLSLVARPL